jgi:predicted anti-sigma-YlaC factor YlaD
MSEHPHSSAASHPDELLAGLVDGTLTPAERAELQTHLEGCERCRAEVRQAESASRALRALPEVEPPWGLGRPAVEESRKRRRAHRFRRLAPAAGVAAAALLLVGLAFAVLRGPQNSGLGNSAAPAEAGGAGRTPAASPAPEPSAAAGLIKRESTNFDAKGIEHLAESYSASTSLPRVPQPQVQAPSTAPGGSSAPAPSAARAVSLADEDAVVACIDSAAGLNPSTRPARVIAAQFEAKPALIGIYLSGPGADQPADLLVVWVASRECRLLHYASHRIAP